MLLITQPDYYGSLEQFTNYAYFNCAYDIIKSPENWKLDDIFPALKLSGVPLGTKAFCKTIAKQMNWRLISNNFCWTSAINKNYLKRNIEICKIEDFLNIKENKFIKSEYELFEAKVYSPDEIKKIIESKKYDAQFKGRILISDPVNFVAKYRFFVNNTYIKAGCCYSINNEINNSQNWFIGVDKIESKLVNWLNNDLISEPSSIDVGVLDNNEIVIINSKPVWSSEIYGCSFEGVIDALQYSCYYDN